MIVLDHFLWTSIHTLLVGFVRCEPDSCFRRNLECFPSAGIPTHASLGLKALKGPKLSQSDDAIFGNSLKNHGVRNEKNKYKNSNILTYCGQQHGSH